MILNIQTLNSLTVKCKKKEKKKAKNSPYQIIQICLFLKVSHLRQQSSRQRKKKIHKIYLSVGKSKLYSQRRLDRNEMIPSAPLFTLLPTVSDTIGWENHTYCPHSDELLSANYFPPAVNRNEAVFLQAWLTTLREACLWCVPLVVFVCFGGEGVTLHKTTSSSFTMFLFTFQHHFISLLLLSFLELLLRFPLLYFHGSLHVALSLILAQTVLAPFFWSVVLSFTLFPSYHCCLHMLFSAVLWFLYFSFVLSPL